MIGNMLPAVFGERLNERLGTWTDERSVERSGLRLAEWSNKRFDDWLGDR